MGLVAQTGGVPAQAHSNNLPLGAHGGDYTLVLSRAVGASGEVWAVEPCLEFMSVCKANAAFNVVTNVRFFDLGLSDEPRPGSLVQTDDPSMSYAAVGEETTQSIRLDTIDELVAQDDSGRRVSFIKLDIEGSELAALIGATRTIRANRPVLLVEMQDSASRRAGHSVESLWQFIQGLGYSMRVYSGQENAWRSVESVVPGQANYLCVPMDQPADPESRRNHS